MSSSLVHFGAVGAVAALFTGGLAILLASESQQKLQTAAERSLVETATIYDSRPNAIEVRLFGQRAYLRGTAMSEAEWRSAIDGVRGSLGRGGAWHGGVVAIDSRLLRIAEPATDPDPGTLPGSKMAAAPAAEGVAALVARTEIPVGTGAPADPDLDGATVPDPDAGNGLEPVLPDLPSDVPEIADAAPDASAEGGAPSLEPAPRVKPSPDLDAIALACAATLAESGDASVVDFLPGATRPTPSSVRFLERTAGAFRRCGPVVITIVGHTDSTGSKAANRAISLQRARNIRDILRGFGVGQAQLRAAGRGSDEPLADNATASGRAMNRRIEFVTAPIERSAPVNTGGRP